MCHDVLNSSVLNKFYYKKIVFISGLVTIETKNDLILVVGNLGRLTHKLHKFIQIQFNDSKHLIVYSKYRNAHNKSLVGTTWSLINSMIIGVTSGFMKTLQLIGIGYRASIEKDSNIINLIVGFSHPVYYVLPLGVKAQCINHTEIVLSGINKHLIGQIAADLRAIRPPEPFKGKGIRYSDEVIRSKDSKKR